MPDMQPVSPLSRQWAEKAARDGPDGHGGYWGIMVLQGFGVLGARGGAMRLRLDS